MGKKPHKKLGKFSSVIATPIGKFGVMFTDGRVRQTSFLPPKTTLVFSQTSKERLIISQIKKYFVKSSHKFKLLVDLHGTNLQQKIWRTLQKIPVGEVRTYGELAKLLQTSPRVIGNACRSNPIPLIIPCHRVVAASGVGGYCGSSSKNIKIKKWLLAYENKNSII
jgi:methylated-DNA-[protein]-cysteine S-methyltransferase